MKTVSREQVATVEAIGELALPPRVQEALGELVISGKEGLLALSVGVGLGVLADRRVRVERPTRAQRRRRARSTSRSAVSREFVAHTREPALADEPPPGRRAAGGADAGRHRAPPRPADVDRER